MVRRPPRLMYRWVPLLLVLPLVGCIEDQQATLAKCELQTRAAGIDPARAIGGPENDDGYRRMRLCMLAAGYDLAPWGVSHRRCDPSRGIPWLKAFCYEPSFPIRKWLYQMELKFRFPERI